MLDKPNLAENKIKARLESEYGIAVNELEFLPIGNDQRAWAYRVVSAESVYFLKLRQGDVRQASLVVPHELNGRGMTQVVAPLPAIAGDLLVTLDDYGLILYPFVAGKSAWGMSLSLAQWRRWGEIMRQIHHVTLDHRLKTSVPSEVFAVNWLETIRRVEEVMQRSATKRDSASAMARLWQERADEIELCRQRYLDLGVQLAANPPKFVLCHADIHTANIIIDDRAAIRIVDWDEAVIAPKERDLMFFIVDGHKHEETLAFFDGYGDKQINWLAMAYYKYDWVIQEFGDYGERVFLRHDLGERELRKSVAEFARLFTPDDVIDRAHSVYDQLLKLATGGKAGIG